MGVYGYVYKAGKELLKKIFKNKTGSGEVIKKIKPNLPQDRLAKATRDLKLAIGKRKGSEARLKLTQYEIDQAIDILRPNLKYILACTSTYPSNVDELNLNYIVRLHNDYPQFKIGFSNHYSGFDASLGAVALGAECIEFHITDDRASYGTDQAASIENSEKLVEGINIMKRMLGNGIKKVYDSEIPIKNKLRKV